MHLTPRWAALALLSALWAPLAGCGGGGSGDGSVTVVTPFVVLADVAGAPLGKMLVPGVAITTTMEGGDTVQLKASPAGVRWVVRSDGNTVAAEVNSDSASWRATIQSPKGGEISIVMQSLADPTQEATLKLLVNPQRYARPSWTAGEASTWRETLTRHDGATVEQTLRHTVTAVTTDGAHTQERRTLASEWVDTQTFDADHNAVTQQRPGVGCQHTPRRALLDFPLYVGKSWQASWQTQCSDLRRETGEALTVVEDHERITVPAGSYDTLRIKSLIAYRDVLDPALTGGVLGQARYAEERVCWWAFSQRRMVRCDSSFTHLGTAPASYPQLRREVRMPHP